MKKHTKRFCQKKPLFRFGLDCKFCIFVTSNEIKLIMNMDIKAVKFRKDGFYTQPFGGEEGPRCKQGKEKFNKA